MYRNLVLFVSSKQGFSALSTLGTRLTFQSIQTFRAACKAWRRPASRRADGRAPGRRGQVHGTALNEITVELLMGSCSLAGHLSAVQRAGSAQLYGLCKLLLLQY
jgi:hypothetical protein